jgi:hypothetical protein
MVAPVLIAIAAAVAAVVLSLIFMPKPKRQKPDETKDLENPVAEAGMTLPVPFGTIMVKGLNCLWFGDKSFAEYEESVGGGGKK